ncbi:MAG: ROK family protein [Patescibacteria group bacterium]
MKTCVDIGGTKVLVAQVDDEGKIVYSKKEPTPKDYSDFMELLGKMLDKLTLDDSVVVVGAPGKINREKGEVIKFGNLPWENAPIKADLKKITGKRVILENDANLAALGEHWSLSEKPEQSLYITVSTGIGTGVVTEGVLDPHHIDSEGGEMLIEHNGKLDTWEHIASGKAIVEKYGVRASELDSETAWHDVCHVLAIGIINLLTVLEPGIIIIGGGVGSHFTKFEHTLLQQLDELKPPLVDIPPIVQASRPEEAVILGCYRLSLQSEGT